MIRHEDVLGGSLWRDDGRQVGQAFDHDETVVDGWSQRRRNRVTDQHGDLTSTTTHQHGDLTSTTTDQHGDLTSTTTHQHGHLTSTTTDQHGDLTSTTTQLVANVNRQEICAAHNCPRTKRLATFDCLTKQCEVFFTLGLFETLSV